MPTHFPWSDAVLSNYIVYVTGLPLTCTKFELLQFICQFGEPIWMELFKNRNSTLHYAHFIFDDLSSYQRFFHAPVHELGESVLKVCMWKKSELSDVLEGARNQRKIFLKNIGPKHNESNIKEYFQRFGQIDSIEFPTNYQTQTTKDIAFVLFRREESVLHALQQPVVYLAGGKIKVRPYSYKKKTACFYMPSPQSLFLQMPQFLKTNSYGSGVMLALGQQAAGIAVEEKREFQCFGGENFLKKFPQPFDELSTKDVIADTTYPASIKSLNLCSIEAGGGGDGVEACSRNNDFNPLCRKWSSHALDNISTASGERIKILHFDSDLGNTQSFTNYPAQVNHKSGREAVVRYFAIDGQL